MAALTRNSVESAIGPQRGPGGESDVKRLVAEWKVLPTLSPQQLVDALLCEVSAVYNNTFDRQNLQRLSSILALSGAELLILPEKNGYGDRGYIRRKANELDFFVWKKVFDFFLEHSAEDDKQFAPRIEQVKEILLESPTFISLLGMVKSGGSTVFEHLIHFLTKLNTEGLEPKERLIMWMDVFHDVGKRYMYDQPFLVELLGQEVPSELKALLRADELDYHGVFAAFEMEAFFKWLMENYSEDYRFIDDRFIGAITRKFRLHHVPAQLDRRQLTLEHLHTLFEDDPDFEQYLYPLLLRMVAADSGSVAAQSIAAASQIADPDSQKVALEKAHERSRWAVKNVSFIFQLIIDIENFLQNTEQELRSVFVEPLAKIILRVIEKSEVTLNEIDDEMKKLLSTIADFVQKYAPAANYSLLQQLTTA